jgi:hypothetical protein
MANVIPTKKEATFDAKVLNPQKVKAPPLCHCKESQHEPKSLHQDREDVAKR